jgi:hypothetical protein
MTNFDWSQSSVASGYFGKQLFLIKHPGEIDESKYAKNVSFGLSYFSNNFNLNS